MEVDGDTVDGMDAAEGDADVAHLDEGRAAHAGAGARGVRGVMLLPPLSLGVAGAGSNPTATTSTTPDDDVLAGVVDPDQGHARRQRLHDHRAQDAPGIVPMPPANDVPPMTAAAMTWSSAPVPRPTSLRSGAR